MQHSLFAILALFAAPWVHAAPTTFAVGEAVKTTSGTVKGHPHKVFPQVSEYLGIRYGQPTSGNLRFAKPIKHASSEAFTADKYGDDCPGVLSNPPPGIMADMAALMQNGTKASEDCLTLNIFTKPQTGEKAKAVMLWIYGGGFALGDSTTPLYDGGLLADEQDVVIVTFNYRLHIFGFPGGPNGTDQNVGLLDQRLAAEWVRDNIAAFGGDPKRITLFGESAGAGSVDMYSYAWAEDPDPIANGFIPQSGSAGALSGPSQASGWYGVSKAVGCGGQEKGTETVTCMRSKKWEDLINNGRSSMFMPTADGKVVFSDYGARQAAGKFIKKPIFIGNNDNEGGFQYLLLPNMTGNAFKPLVDRVMGGVETMMNSLLACPAGGVASARMAHGVPAWRYRYMAAYPNSQIVAGHGAVHGAEIALVWGTMENTPNAVGMTSTPDEIALSKVMRHAWAEFAKDPQNGLTKLGWPKYDPNQKTLIRLGYQNAGKADLVMGNEYDKGCPAGNDMSSILGGMMGSMLGGSTNSSGLTSLLGGLLGGGSASTSSSGLGSLLGGLLGGTAPSAPKQPTPPKPLGQ